LRLSKLGFLGKTEAEPRIPDEEGGPWLPHSSVTFSGAVNKASNGQSCFALVVDNLTMNGTGSILETGGCAAAGLAMPTGNLPGRGELVL
jgi:hypothetical protein